MQEKLISRFDYLLKEDRYATGAGAEDNEAVVVGGGGQWRAAQETYASSKNSEELANQDSLEIFTPKRKQNDDLNDLSFC